MSQSVPYLISFYSKIIESKKESVLGDTSRYPTLLSPLELEGRSMSRRHAELQKI